MFLSPLLRPPSGEEAQSMCLDAATIRLKVGGGGLGAGPLILRDHGSLLLSLISTLHLAF